ncbi:MAG: hypothetical protein U5K43_01480 [Halofilum sp. (in: g-proteobacteria)]|nr:hypothetical protein [Halofilum sp. (in: g-proteobacteria)]
MIDQRVDLGLRPAHHLGSEADVLPDREPLEQRALLEHHAALRARADDRFVVEPDIARGRREEAGDDVEQRGLAAAGWTEDGQDLAILQAERDVL